MESINVIGLMTGTSCDGMDLSLVNCKKNNNSIDGKTIKNSPENVVKAIELFLDTYFGDDVFTVDLSKNEYNIKNTIHRPPYVKII